MIHGWMDTAHGWPPVLRVTGGPADGRTYATLAEALASLAAVDRGRETYRIWCSSAEELYYAARAEGLMPELSIVPGHGVTSLTIVKGVQIWAARPMLPEPVLEQGHDGAAALAAVRRTIHALESRLGVGADSGIGGATTAALWGGRWMPRLTYWPEDADDADARLCQDAYHGGFTRCFAARGILTAGAERMDVWQDDEPETLPAGWRLLEIDRASAYAADASGILPDTAGPVEREAGALMACEGGAICDARVDLSGFTGLAFPVRIELAAGVKRSIPAKGGAWRGIWCSDMLRWAQAKGAQVEILGGVGWRRGACFAAPLMDRLYAWAGGAEPGSVERHAYKASIQRAVGRWGRRHYDTATLCGAAAQDEIAHPERWPMRWRTIHGHGGGYFVADRLESTPGVPRGAMPPWPAFVVGRAWIAMCEQLAKLEADGVRALYADTDGICAAVPPGWRGAPEGPAGIGMGAWRVKRTFDAAEHQAERRFARREVGGAEVIQYAGVRKDLARRRLMGEEAPDDRRSALMDLRSSFLAVTRDVLTPVLDSTRLRVERMKRAREERHGSRFDE